MAEKPEDFTPPGPPEVRRSFALYSFQVIGLPLLILFPVLALLGVFGETFDQVQAASDALEMTVDYPSRYRYKMINDLQVSVRNNSDQTLQTLTVSFSSDYIDRFSTVTFTPDVSRVTGDIYEVELTEVAPGETQVIRVEIQGEQYGQHTGHITAAADGLAPVEVQVATFIFP